MISPRRNRTPSQALSVGLLIAFGFLLIPTLMARTFARNMRQFVIAASLTGVVSAFVGFYIAYRWDFPVGPTDIVLLGMLYAAAWVGSKFYPVRSNDKNNAPMGPCS